MPSSTALCLPRFILSLIRFVHFSLQTKQGNRTLPTSLALQSSYIRQLPLLMHLQASPRVMYVAPGSSARDTISFPAALTLAFIITVTSVITICGCFQPTERRPLQFVICGVSFISSEILLVVVSSMAYGTHCPPPRFRLELIDGERHQGAYLGLLLLISGFSGILEVRCERSKTLIC